MVMNSAISPSKANRLFWLGRYAERVYTSLHLLRRYHDRMLDGDPEVYKDFFLRVDTEENLNKVSDYRMWGLYDTSNSSSILSELECANDNAIVLREEVSSETLSYIQMSLVFVKEHAAQNDVNVANLQPITDYLLAFWGAVENKIFDFRIRNLLNTGRLLETVDLLVRFSYPLDRVLLPYFELKKCEALENRIFDQVALSHLNMLLTKKNYLPKNTDAILKCINSLIVL